MFCILKELIYRSAGNEELSEDLILVTFDDRLVTSFLYILSDF